MPTSLVLPEMIIRINYFTQHTYRIADIKQTLCKRSASRVGRSTALSMGGFVFSCRKHFMRHRTNLQGKMLTFLWLSSDDIHISIMLVSPSLNISILTLQLHNLDHGDTMAWKCFSHCWRLEGSHMSCYRSDHSQRAADTELIYFLRI